MTHLNFSALSLVVLVAFFVPKSAYSEDCLRNSKDFIISADSPINQQTILRPCPGVTDGTLIIRGRSSRRTKIIGSKSASDLGLKWTRVTQPQANGKKIDYLKDAPIYKIGPLPHNVSAVYWTNSLGQREQLPISSSKKDANTSFYKGIGYYGENECGGAKSCVKGDSLENPTWPLRTYGITPGLQVIVRDTDWSYLRTPVVWVHPTKPEFATNDSLAADVSGYKLPIIGSGFRFVNALYYVTEPKSWSHDSATKMLYIWTPEANNRAPKNIRFALNDETSSSLFIDLQSKNINLLIKDIEVLESPENAITVVNGKNVTFQNVVINHSGGTGLVAFNLDQLKIQSSVISNTASDGLAAFDVRDKIEAYNNVFEKNGFLANQKNLGMAFNGMRIGSTRSLSVVKNSFSDSGFSGVSVGSKIESDMFVSGNSFNGFCKILNDCGGFYYNGLDQSLKTYRQYITENAFRNGVGNTEGAGKTPYQIVAAIYLDNYGSYFEISKNSITSYSGIGILLHGGGHNKVFSNTFKTIWGPSVDILENPWGDPAQVNKCRDNLVYGNSFSTESPNVGLIRYTTYQQKANLMSMGYVQPNQNFSHPKGSHHILEHLNKKSGVQSFHPPR